MSESLVRGRFHSGSHSESLLELGPEEHLQVTFLKEELCLGLVEHCEEASRPVFVLEM